MTRTHPAVPFERYADDAICACHCRTQSEAETLGALLWRSGSCVWVEQLHSQKTKTVYHCVDTSTATDAIPRSSSTSSATRSGRGSRYGPTGHTASQDSPAGGVPRGRQKAMRREVRQWGLQNRTDTALNESGSGWLILTSAVGSTTTVTSPTSRPLYDSLRRIDFHLVMWCAAKFKRFKQKPKKARANGSPVSSGPPQGSSHNWPLLTCQQPRYSGAG